MRALVTGAAGFIGSPRCGRLVAKQYDVADGSQRREFTYEWHRAAGHSVAS